MNSSIATQHFDLARRKIWRVGIASLFLLISGFIPNAVWGADTVLVQTNAVWKYLDNGSNQGTAWPAIGFDDATWSAGPAKLGYGDGDEATVVNCGPTAPLCATNNYVTTYFRHSFTVNDLAGLRSLRMRLLRDDAAVVYLNGAEIRRENMPAGPIGYMTKAEAQLRATAEGTFFESLHSPSLLHDGVNVLAVEIHQRRNNSADMGFALELLGSDQVAITRAPYLQMVTPTSVVIRWRTSVPTDSRVRYGTDPQNLDEGATDGTETTEHVVALSGLTPRTRYQFSVGTTTAMLVGDSGCHFVTAPPIGARQPIRVWAVGDGGTANANAAAVRDAYLDLPGSPPTDVLVMMGDNAYDSGTDSEYQHAVFDMHAPMLEQTALWPTMGNHDTAGMTNPPANLPYFQIFTLPTNGEAGGMPSGTERYYSYDYGNVHFIVLDSMTSRAIPGSEMLLWLQNDLACTTNDWIIAYWHHPPYSKGHDSDKGREHTEMRQNALPILESGGVDLVLNGDSHAYERSYLLSGHYGLSSTLTDAMKLDSDNGREEEGGAYHKPMGISANRGTVYVVAGCAGSTVGGALGHPVMHTSLNVIGSVVLDIDGNRLDARFLGKDGVIRDHFTILKDITNSLPSVNITSPSGGDTFTKPVDITVTASALDSDGTISQVDFYVESNLIATETSQPFEALWQNPPEGNHELIAVVTDDLGATISSSPVHITVNPSPFPSQPIGLTGTSVSTNVIQLSWGDASADEDGFQIERLHGSFAFGTIVSLPRDVTSYSDQGLLSLTPYTYRVRAFNSQGSSPYTDPIVVKTLGPPPVTPTNLVAKTISTNRIDLTWKDKSKNETGFRVELSNDGTNFALIATVNSNATSYTSAGLTPHTTYFYRVRSTNANGGDSLPSHIASAATFPPPPESPTNLKATALSCTEIQLTWKDNADNEDATKIDRKTDGLFTRIATLSPNSTNYLDTTCQQATTYTYRIRAFNTGGNSLRVVGATAATLACPPTTPDLISPDDSGVSSTDDITSSNMLMFQGTAAPNLTVKLYRDNTEIGSTVASGGVYQITATLPEGTHPITAKALNSQGKLSAASAALEVTVDPSPPTINVSSTSAPNANGWDESDVTASYTASDTGAGLLSLATGSFTFNSDGANQSHTFTVQDLAGNAASATISHINIDKTPPTITVSRTPDANANGWNSTDVTASYSASDALSGLGSPAFDSFPFTSEGTGQSHSFMVQDLAGNTASATIDGVNIDKTPPTTVAAASPDKNANGWNNTGVSVNFSGSDALSGLESCSDPLTLGNDGAGQSASGTCVDKAGNLSEPATVDGINIDKTPPTITLSRTPAANDNDWNNSNVNAMYSANDAGSGLASPVSGSFDFTSEGANQFHDFAVQDLAGNSASATVAGVNIDKTPPTITVSRTPGPNANGWNNGDVTANYSANDAGSGLAAPATGSFLFDSEGAGQSHSFTVQDQADNSASATISNVRIDKTPPTITVSRTPGPNSNGWNNVNVTANYSADDAGSGLASPTTGSFLFTSEGAGQSHAFNVQDRANNTASATVNNVHVDKTAPPAPTISNGPSNPTSSTSASFSFTDTESGVMFLAQLDGSGFSVAASPKSYSSLTPGAHTFQVKARDLADNESGVTPHAWNISTLPAIPTGLVATPSNAVVRLSWTASSGASSYRVKRSTTSGGPYTVIASSVVATSYTNAPLSNGTTYHYVVSATNASGESANSTQASATPQAPPSAPSGLGVDDISQTRLDLDWNDNSNNEAGFRIERSLTNSNFVEIATVGPNVEFYSDTGLQANTEYYYRVRAYNAGGNSGYSSVQHKRTK